MLRCLPLVFLVSSLALVACDEDAFGGLDGFGEPDTPGDTAATDVGAEDVSVDSEVAVDARPPDAPDGATDTVSDTGRPPTSVVPDGYPAVVFNNAITCTVAELDDRGETPQSTRDLLRRNLEAACDIWAAHLDGSGELTMRLIVAEDSATGRGYGTSLGVHFHGRESGLEIWAQGAAAKLQVGEDVNGAEPDVEILLDPDYLPLLWLDPDPWTRTATPQAERLDAVSVLMHELGHAFAFNGWFDTTTGEPTAGAVRSTFDRHVDFDGEAFWFVGANALEIYGEQVRLARDISPYMHVGNSHDDDPALVGDLMNGVVLEYARRYHVSHLDLAILEDSAVRTRQP